MLYASNALLALAVGFGVASAATAPIRRLQKINAMCAFACGLATLALLPLTRGAQSSVPRNPPLTTEPSNAGLDFSIIVPVYNRPQFIRTILGIFSSQAELWGGLGQGEIVVVDDGSVDETLEVAKAISLAMPIETRVISVARSGPGGARNAGFAAARGTIGVSIDSDCRPDAGWLRGLLLEVRSGSKTVAFSRVRSQARGAYPIDNVPDLKGFVTASFAMNRQEFCELGGFFPAYRVSHQDLDFVQLARSNGYRIARADSFIDHPTRRENPASMWRAGLNSKHANLFARRHGTRALGLTPTTPYYFFGIAGNYGSSIGFLITSANFVAFLFLLITRNASRKDREWAAKLLAEALALYVTALGGLGLVVGAGIGRLPFYIATLASFQLATLVGRLQGTCKFRLLLL
jgi:glycosyltransferase involved in cell wall biosynthesis